jgi:hypothetical protein
MEEISVALRALPATCPPSAALQALSGGSVRKIPSPSMLLTKGLVLGSSCSGEGTIVNQKTHRGGWANEQDPISFGERWGFCG